MTTGELEPREGESNRRDGRDGSRDVAPGRGAHTLWTALLTISITLCQRHNATNWCCAAHNTTHGATKVLLFGGSGQTGRYVAKFSSEADHDVIAFVRNPDKLPLSPGRGRESLPRSCRTN